MANTNPIMLEEVPYINLYDNMPSTNSPLDSDSFAPRMPYTEGFLNGKHEFEAMHG